jgi:hypothetical protein
MQLHTPLELQRKTRAALLRNGQAWPRWMRRYAQDAATSAPGTAEEKAQYYCNITRLGLAGCGSRPRMQLHLPEEWLAQHHYQMAGLASLDAAVGPGCSYSNPWNCKREAQYHCHFARLSLAACGNRPRMQQHMPLELQRKNLRSITAKWPGLASLDAAACPGCSYICPRLGLDGCGRGPRMPSCLATPAPGTAKERLSLAACGSRPRVQLRMPLELQKKDSCGITAKWPGLASLDARAPFLAHAIQALLGSLDVSLPSVSMQDCGMANHIWWHPSFQHLIQPKFSPNRVIGLHLGSRHRAELHPAVFVVVVVVLVVVCCFSNKQKNPTTTTHKQTLMQKWISIPRSHFSAVS